MEREFYRIAGGRIWDTAKGAFIAPAELPEGAEALDLISAEGDDSEGYLARALSFYGLPLGELAEPSPTSIKRELAKLDELYLTPCVLAGLASGDDPTARAYYEAHERLAAPLREKLAELEEPAAPAAVPDSVNGGAEESGGAE